MWALLLSVSVVACNAQTVHCGSTITRSGSYTLGESCAGGLWVRANHVNLTLSGKVLKCGSNRFGIWAGGVRGLRIYGGKIRNCEIGIHAPNASNAVIDGVDFTGTKYIGVSLGGQKNTIRNSTFNTFSGRAGSGYVIGINNPGPDCSITRNTFRELYKKPGVGEGVAILLRNGTCTIQHNWIENDAVDINIGIWVASQAAAVVRENAITNFGRAIVGSGVVQASDNRLLLNPPIPGSTGISGSSGVSSDNLIYGFETPVTIPSFGDTIQ